MQNTSDDEKMSEQLSNLKYNKEDVISNTSFNSPISERKYQHQDMTSTMKRIPAWDEVNLEKLSQHNFHLCCQIFCRHLTSVIHLIFEVYEEHPSPNKGLQNLLILANDLGKIYSDIDGLQSVAFTVMSKDYTNSTNNGI